MGDSKWQNLMMASTLSEYHANILSRKIGEGKDGQRERGSCHCDDSGKKGGKRVKDGGGIQKKNKHHGVATARRAPMAPEG